MTAQLKAYTRAIVQGGRDDSYFHKHRKAVVINGTLYTESRGECYHFDILRRAAIECGFSESTIEQLSDEGKLQFGWVDANGVFREGT